MTCSTFLALLPLLMPQGTPTAPPTGVRLPALVTIDGAWVGSGNLICLKERPGGRLLGCVANDPGTIMTAGTLTGGSVSLTFQGEDGGGPLTTSLFSGTFSGASIRGFYDDGSGPVALTLTRPSTASVVEHWLLVDSASDGKADASRLTQAGVFYGGGFRGILQCDFPACGGSIDSWTVSGASHLIDTSSSGPCTLSTSLTGTLDPTTKILSGSYSSIDCVGTSSGMFMGGKRGLTNDAHIQQVLSLVADLCDALEAESPSAVDALHSGYMHDGRTAADAAADFANWYAGYHSIEATPILSRIISIDDGEVPAILSGPNRLDWQLVVTGIPNGGSARETIIDYQTAPFEDEVHYLGMEGTRRVFVGNDQSAPFSMDMPIAAGDGALNTYGIWPYGVHGGSHPEGHQGIDIEFAAGASTLAATDGTVTYLERNSTFPARWDLILAARPGVNVQYDHMGTPDPAIAVGATVVRGQVLGTDANSIHVHLALVASSENACPLDFLSSAGQTTFNSLWPSAFYREELVEPLPCNPHPVTFPLTASRSLISGSLPAARIEFTRLEAGTDDMTYTLYDTADNAFETGIVSHLTASHPLSEADLTPTSPVGPTRLCVMDIVGQDLWIDWDTAVRPTNLASASHYALDHTKLYVSNMLDGSISVLDLSTNTVTDTISVGTAPAHLAYSPALEMIFVGDLGMTEISRVDTSTDTLALPSVSISAPSGAVDIDLTTGKVYGVDSLPEPAFGTQIHIIDGPSATEDPGSPISIGIGIQDIRVDQVNGLAYVTAKGDGTSGTSGVNPFDTTTNTAGPIIPLSDHPHGLAIDTLANLLYVTQVEGASVSVIDTDDPLALPRSISVGSCPEWIALNRDGSRAYVTNRDDGTVSIISHDSGVWSVSGLITVSPEPFFVTVDKVSNKACITHIGGDTVTIIDTNSNQVIATIPVGGMPVGAVFVRYNL